MSAQAVAAGATLTFSGRFEPGEQVTAALTRVRSTQADLAYVAGAGRSSVLGVFPADSQGHVLGAAVIPARTAPGIYEFTLTGRDDTPTYAAQLIVVRPDSD